MSETFSVDASEKFTNQKGILNVEAIELYGDGYQLVAKHYFAAPVGEQECCYTLVRKNITVLH